MTLSWYFIRQQIYLFVISLDYALIEGAFIR